MNAAHHDMALFGSWVKYQHYVQTSNSNVPRILSSQEIALAADLGSNFDFTNAFRQRLELGRDLYTGVRQNLMTILQIWDAVMDERDIFETSGSFTLHQDIQKAFIFCTDTITARVNVGSLGPQGLPNYTPTSRPPKLQICTEKLGPYYAGHGQFFADITAVGRHVQQSIGPYTEFLALSDSGDAGNIEINDEDKEETVDENEHNDEGDYTDDDDDDDDNKSDDDYQEENSENDTSRISFQAQGTPIKKGRESSLDKLVKFDMAWVNDTQGFSMGSEPDFEELSRPAPSLSTK
ncbi:hypothetical protein MGG_02014 [Pyricularia oryzae 70-15]|uniref:Uncharacterized protein n=3 Tax=Pyricularia oryzae TaxID=318829 RepID=G4MMR7_PYRO7|nr:uncharacterized protein MGG_02014 [Pyricularia oryzae 70-15]EHA56147.1 hypothetical protein MGG_02014 [Pyricularia oryzae 70-15]ELQ43186.1 hypothetical protein OOU_Y34scaffold00165g8 [Pyricularia oryzae Y34]KAI7912024.1 hypothetical protein M9X92_010239 [Pyricularia oryzae]KAI7912964.1 hypothetical protein M0657_010219 [Pyricularia oryzae]